MFTIERIDADNWGQMRRDLATLGGQPYKNHRVYRKAL